MSAKGREGARRKPFFVHGGPRRGTENTLTPFCPRRGTKGQGEHLFCPRRGAKGREEDLFLSTEGRGGPRRTTKKTLFCPRRGAKGREENLFCPRRAAEDHEGPRRKPFFVREGARRGAKKTFFVREGARRGRENRAIASKFGRHSSPRRAPTRGAPTDAHKGRPYRFREPHVDLSQFDAIALGWRFPRTRGIDLCGFPVACLNWGRAENRRKRRI